MIFLFLIDDVFWILDGLSVQIRDEQCLGKWVKLGSGSSDGILRI